MRGEERRVRGCELLKVGNFGCSFEGIVHNQRRILLGQAEVFGTLHGGGEGGIKPIFRFCVDCTRCQSSKTFFKVLKFYFRGNYPQIHECTPEKNLRQLKVE